MYNIFQEVLDSVHIKNLRHDLGDNVAKDYAEAVIMLYQTNKYIDKTCSIRIQKLKDILLELFGSCELEMTYDDHCNTVFYLR